MDPHYLNGAQDGSGRGRGGHPGRGRGGPPNASGPRLARVELFYSGAGVFPGFPYEFGCF
jgi:hypothetical protein